MSRAVQTRRLKDHIASLETMTRFVLATLALGSGVYTYLGVRSLLDGSATRRLLRRRHLCGLGLGRHLRLLDLHDPLPAGDARRRLAAALRRHHGGRLGDDRRHGVLAECRGARRLRSGRAASRDHARGLHRRSRPGAWQCARRAFAAARHPARRRSVSPGLPGTSRTPARSPAPPVRAASCNCSARCRRR